MRWASCALDGAGTEAALLDHLVKQLENKADGGTLNVLRSGFSIAGAGTLAMSPALPEDARNETVAMRYARRHRLPAGQSWLR